MSNNDIADDARPLGKGEVVSSILTGSTRHAPTCGLFVLAFFRHRTNGATHEHGKNPGTLLRAHSQLSGNRSLMFACLRMTLFRLAWKAQSTQS
jgi:hypothetical protein